MNQSYFDPVPMSLRISDALQQDIDQGTYQQGDKLPSESKLCKQFNTNRYTVRHALDRLAQAGLIRPRHGKGYYVNEKPLEIIYPIAPETRYSEMIRQSGHVPDARLVSCEQHLASLEVQKELNLTAHDKVYKLHILRYADTIPLSWSETWLPEKHFPGLKRELKSFQSLYGIFEEVYRIQPRRLYSTFHATFPNAQEVSYLQVSPNTPLLQIGSVATCENHHHIEYTLAKYRGDICRVRMQFDSSMINERGKDNEKV